MKGAVMVTSARSGMIAFLLALWVLILQIRHEIIYRRSTHKLKM